MTPLGSPEDDNRVTVRLAASDLAAAERIGEGNVSEGIRRALAAYGGKTDEELATEYARYLRSLWVSLERMKKGTDTSNLLWIESRLEKDWNVKVGPALCGAVLSKLKSTDPSPPMIATGAAGKGKGGSE